MKLPSATEMGLLVALGSQRLTGRQLAKRFADETERTISYGSLYTTMSRLRDAGWVEQTDAEDEDGRLRFFRVTGKGERAMDDARQFYTRLLGLAWRAQ